ncbi:MAG: hypothetical protein AAB803_02470 [Patescibacteria group bacterium]
MSEALKAFIEQCCKSAMLQPFSLSEIRPGEILDHMYTCMFTVNPGTFRPAAAQLVHGAMIGVKWNEGERSLVLAATIQYHACSHERVEEIVHEWNLRTDHISRVVGVTGIADSTFLLIPQCVIKLATGELPVDDSAQPERDRIAAVMALFIAECIELAIEPF